MKLTHVESRSYSIELDHIELWKLQELIKDSIISLDQKIDLFKDSDIVEIYQKKKKELLKTLKILETN